MPSHQMMEGNTKVCSKVYPTCDQVRTIVAQGAYKRVPICEEVLSDRYTPVELMRTLRSASNHCFLLESAEQGQAWGRYSFLGCNPTVELTCAQGQLRMKEKRQGEQTVEKVFSVDHPDQVIRDVLAAHLSPNLPEMPPFSGGLVGYFSYEYFAYNEPSLRKDSVDADAPKSTIPTPSPPATSLPEFCDVDLMLFDQVIVFDHYRQKLLIIAGVYPDHPQGLAGAFADAQKHIDHLKALIASNTKAYFPPLKLYEPLKAQYSLATFSHMVTRAQNYIREGDIFQVVLSNPLSARCSGSIFDAYRLLRTTNPSPYLFYFSSTQSEIAGASPETLASLQGGVLRTFPLAGTRPRGKNEAEDADFEHDLLSNEKECAEHTMLVDLGRNDLGRVCQRGSVVVKDYMSIKRFSHVMHIASEVVGILRSDCDGLDAINSVLPAGTLSGAPKLRACQIIRELETRRRGIYGGAVGYLDFAGNMDMCISIRLAYKKGDQVCIQSGAGIVSDSDPHREYEECSHKAVAVLKAVQAAEGGIE